MHALDTMRMESGFLHWGNDISPEENQYQAGLNFTISYKKDSNIKMIKLLEELHLAIILLISKKILHLVI